VGRIYQQWDKPATGCWAPKAHWCEGNKGYPVWSELTEGLLWHKSHYILIMLMGGMCHITVHRTLLHMVLCSSRPVKGMTTVHCWKPLQWVHECTHYSANWTRCGKMTVGGWSLMLWAMFCQVTVGPAIYVDINLTLATYLNIANLGTLLSGNAIPWLQ